MAIAGLWLHRKREPLPDANALTEPRELRLVTGLFLILIASAMALSPLGKTPRLYPAIALNSVVWTLLGFLLTAMALVKGVREWVG